jgi:NADH-quinone oxidoreductase subunit L
VIIGMHHDQDIRNMGGLRKYMPITWITSLIGSLALIGTPFLSGFYSKDSIIEAVKFSHLAGSGFAYFAVTAGVFVTAFYSFRMYFLVFHGKERFKCAHDTHDHEADKNGDAHGHHHGGHSCPKETPWVVTLPLILLAIPSLIIGYLTIEPLMFGNWFGHAVFIAESHESMHELAHHFHGAFTMALHALTTLPFLLAAAGVGLSWFFYMKRPDIPAMLQKRFSLLHSILENKYGFDAFNEWFFARGARLIGGKFWRWGDVAAIDGLMVNGTARMVGRIAGVVRHLQSGYIYHYAFAMIIGVLLLATWFVRA